MEIRTRQTNGVAYQGTQRQPDLSAGLCASGRYPPDTWFPVTYQGHALKRAEEAAAYLCTMCPVLDPCLEYVASRCEPEGVWGATLPRERKRARSKAWRQGLTGADFTEAVARDLWEAVRRRGAPFPATGATLRHGRG